MLHKRKYCEVFGLPKITNVYVTSIINKGNINENTGDN